MNQLVGKLLLIVLMVSFFAYKILSPKLNADNKLKNFWETIPFQYAVIKNNVVFSYSEDIKEIITSSGKKFDKFVLSLSKELGSQVVMVGDVYYRVIAKSFTDEKTRSEYTILSFFENGYSDPERLCVYDRTIVALTFIDNYDEVIETTEEVKVPLLMALVDKKLNDMAQQVGGIVKKFEKDKYIFIFSQEKLEYLKNRKFDILEQVKSLDVGNKLPVTLSIGIGLEGENLSSSLGAARAATDLALGRGGDQALIKNGNNYTFYGGNTKENAYNSRVRARVKAYAFGELLEEARNVIITGHKNGDLDSLGSAVGVFKMVYSAGKQGNIILNTVTSSIKSLYDRIKEDEIYKNNVFITEEEGLAKINDKTLLIIVDTHRAALLECGSIYGKVGKIVLFDHHRRSPDFIENAVLTYHEPYASSTSELITEMIQYYGKVKLTDLEADALLSGIVLDTKNFSFNTGAKTFESAAYLKRNGADSTRVRLLFRYSIEDFKLKSIGVNSAEIFMGNIAISVAPENPENPTLTAAQIADELLNILGVDASFVLCQIENGVIMSARSLFGLNVQVIMEKLGGGGHRTVAGAQLSGENVETAKEKLKTAILKYLEENKK